jgi:hypothetical protein
VRKINELVKRVRLAKVHAYIIGHLKEQMPVMMGHAKKQTQVGCAVSTGYALFMYINSQPAVPHLL